MKTLYPKTDSMKPFSVHDETTVTAVLSSQYSAHCLMMSHPVTVPAAAATFASHRIASHRIASHRIASHRIASHRIASHRVASHRRRMRCVHASPVICV
jgi:hypothetical protein